MKTSEELKELEEMLEYAFVKLVCNDEDLVRLDDSFDTPRYTNTYGCLERKLHEVCINHRLAFYLEKYISEHFTVKYKVDIEYNRYYKDKKILSINGGKPSVVRPDIVIHTRAEKVGPLQHYLVIEAKKDTESEEDKSVVKSFMQDPHYKYKYGLFVKYNDFNPINATLFFNNGEVITSKDLEFPQRENIP